MLGVKVVTELPLWIKNPLLCLAELRAHSLFRILYISVPNRVKGISGRRRMG
jgi:hypothetical protein